MTTGMDWALKAVITSLGLDPEKVKNDLAGLVQIIDDAGKRLHRIENQNLAIMKHLGIEIPIANGADHGTERLSITGAESGTESGTDTPRRD